MADLHYTHPDLVALYDTFNGWGPDRAHYASLPGAQPVRVLEVGCGTGLIARDIAGQGHDVTGLDPAQPMLDFAATQPHGHLVAWRCGVLAGYHAEPFDLIYMTGHAFQCMLTDEEICEFFDATLRLLRADGQLVFETRNPSARAWERWVPEHTTLIRELPDGRLVTEWHELESVVGETVAFRSIYQFPDRQLVSESVLRFADCSTLSRLAEQCGLKVVSVAGDWDGSPLGARSPETIMTLERG